MIEKNIKILLIADEERNIHKLSKILNTEGYSIDTTIDANSAIEMLNNNHFDIVITDLNIPRKTGYDIVEHIAESYTDTLTLVITDHASYKGAIKAIKLGAYDFIYKPIDATSLKHAIKRASESSPQSTKVCNNPKRTKVSAKMERTVRTSLMQLSHLITFNARAFRAHQERVFDFFHSFSSTAYNRESRHLPFAHLCSRK